MADGNDVSGLFNRIPHNRECWDGYLETRPQYSQDFYELIYAYRGAGTGLVASFDTAHDVASGPGHVAAQLASKFKRVVASDINASNLEIAKARLASLHGSDRVKFIESSAEDLADKLPASEADLVTAPMSIDLMDASRALQSFASLLRPGGTIAIWLYGRPCFAEDEFNRTCQPIFNRFPTRYHADVLDACDPAGLSNWKAGTEIMNSFLDTVAVPSAQWTNIKRHKWNNDLPFAFFNERAGDFELDLTSKVGSSDGMLEKIDRDFWAVDWTVEDVKNFIDYLLPEFRGSKLQSSEEIQLLYAELEGAMGGKDAKRRITWPAALILATKR